MVALLLSPVLALALAAAPDAPPADAAAVPPADTAPAPSPPDAPPAVPAEAPAEPAPPAEIPVAPPPAPVKRPLRIAVQSVKVSGDLSPRLEPIFTASLVTELRKLDHASVIGMDEVRDLLAIESEKQTAGCNADSCLNELAEALGADLVVTVALAELDGAHLVSFRRLDARDGKTAGVDKRFDGGNGEELLGTIGPAVQELFNDFGLKEGAERGVDKEAGSRLNPPPLAPWMTIAVGAAAGGALVGAVGAGVVSKLLEQSVQARIDASVKTPANGAELKRDFDTSKNAAVVANVLYAVGAGLGLATGAMAIFTDWWGYGE
jgi:hypothetical protein